MNLNEIEKNKAQFIEQLRVSRRAASFEVHIGSGVRIAEDISQIVNNRITEKANWEHLYLCAMEFD